VRTHRCSVMSLVRSAAVVPSLVALASPLHSVEECQYHVIQEVPLPMPFSVMEVGPGDVVYGWCAHTLWASENRGENWEVIRAFPETLSCTGLFVSSSGDVFAGITHHGRLWRGVPGET
jgi:hypothetical protein